MCCRPSGAEQGPGLINLAVTLLHATAPFLLEGLGFGFCSLFIAAVVSFACATLALAAIRRVK